MRTVFALNRNLVGPGRVELPTPALSERCSNQLSYRPEVTSPFWAATKQKISKDQSKYSGLSRLNSSALLTSIDLIVSLLKRHCCRSQKITPRKEVIQPQVPLRLPCYDFTPIIDLTLGGSLLTVRTPTSGEIDFRGVTGGVYKARERIHRGVLIRDY